VPKPGRGLKGVLRVRIIGLALVLSFGFILIVSLAASAALAALGGWLSHFVPGWVVLGYVLNYGVATAVIALLFALILKVLPDAKVAWRDVWLGALVTSVLFQLGKLGIGIYLGQATVASTFGAAGSLAVLLVWVYYSAQILLLGGEFTRVWANRFGDRVVPDDNAMPAPHGESDRLALEKGLKAAHEDERRSPAPRPLQPARR
jgi:membrane protein